MNNLDKKTMIIKSKYHESCSSFIGWRYRWKTEDDGLQGSFAELLLPVYNEKFNLVFEHEQLR